jgi:hypothetical protein
MRTFCQSVNLEVSICSCQAVRFPQVGFGQRLGYADVKYISGDEYRTGTHLRVLELLLDFVDETTANFTNEATEEELRADFARPSDGAADAHQSSDLVRSQITDTGNKRQMVKRDIKLARLEIGRISRRSRRVDLEVIGLVFSDEVQEGAAKVGKKSVVLLLDGICEDVIFLEEMAVIDVEGGELVFTHGVDLLDVDEFAICDLGKITI